MIRFTCPRCGFKESLPEEVIVAGVACRECEGRFYLDEQGRFDAHPPTKSSNRSRTRTTHAKPAEGCRLGRRSLIVTLAAIIGCAALAAGAAWKSRLSDVSPREASLRFTLACARGQIDEARCYVTEESLPAFEAWAALNFPYAFDPMISKPTDVKAAIFDIAPDEPFALPEAVADATPLTTSADLSNGGRKSDRRQSGSASASAAAELVRVRLVLGDENQGQRLQTQYWRRAEGGWRFDPLRTLAALGPPDESRATPRSQVGTHRPTNRVR